MPTIYHAHCDLCQYTSDVFPAEYGAVFVDEPPMTAGSGSVLAGAVLNEQTLNTTFAEQADPRMVVLAHPLEESILAGTGYTWIKLALVGRYFRFRRVICRSCGTLFEVRWLTCPPGLGCQVGCVSGILAGIGYGVWRQSFCAGFWAGYGIVLGCYVLASSVGWLYTRLRFRARARELDGPSSCPTCGSTHHAGVESRRIFPCPRCGEQAMSVRSVGMS